jgi:2-polyprenyl-3-methyl-5-hydroxy-6-metoxy-1,4-benzoquinol methylase
MSLGWISRKLKRTTHQEGTEASSDWYDNAFSTVEEYRLHYTESQYYFLWTVIADRVRKQNLGSILDLGCGPGQFALFMRDIGITSYTGIDFSPVSIGMARDRCPDFNFVIEDLGDSSTLKGSSYDCVISLECLEHIEADTKIIEQIKPGSTFFGTVPNFPYTSHVRHFNNEGEVTERYSRFFENFCVTSHLANPHGKTFFLMEGIKL